MTIIKLIELIIDRAVDDFYSMPPKERTKENLKKIVKREMKK